MTFEMKTQTDETWRGRTPPPPVADYDRVNAIKFSTFVQMNKMI